MSLKFALFCLLLTQTLLQCESHDHCAGHSCPEGHRCVTKEDGTANFVPECLQVTKPGLCPTYFTPSVQKNLLDCSDDADCSARRKCCQNICRLPVLNVSGKEDGSVILRCRASGNPKPTITWSRNGAKIEPETGRYVLPSTGDLEILNLKMADAGVYACTESNGVGEILSKEFNLAVHQIVRGRKRITMQKYSDEWRNFHTFEPFKNTTIDTKTSEIASDRDERVTGFVSEWTKTISYLPIKVAEVFPSLTEYKVFSCSVTEIGSVNFRKMKLEKLELNFNKITSIDKDVFEELIALKRLDLSDNQLTSLHEDTFSNNRALEALHLNRNKFESLPLRLLKNLSELSEISLNDNKLKSLDVNFFTHNLKLEQVWLYHNNIEHLDADTFKGLRKLTLVSLSRNKCVKKPYGRFDMYVYADLSELSSDLARNCSQTFA